VKVACAVHLVPAVGPLAPALEGAAVVCWAMADDAERRIAAVSVKGKTNMTVEKKLETNCGGGVSLFLL
jgi:hypothetical protein